MLASTGMPLTDARIAQLFDARNDASHADYGVIRATEDRYWLPIFEHQHVTGDMPRVLRFERPGTDIEEAVQLVTARYVMKFSRRPVLIEYTTPPTPRRLPSKAERIASVSIRHAWRVGKRIATTPAAS